MSAKQHAHFNDCDIFSVLRRMCLTNISYACLYLVYSFSVTLGCHYCRVFL